MILVVGVNGTGKTTTIGKLAHRLREHGHDVLVAAADTFRAAAGSSSRSGRRGPAPTTSARREAAIRRRSPSTRSRLREARGRDVVIVDTAGRLHTQKGLMEELDEGAPRDRAPLEGAPHETLLVLDATTGQNGLQQARLFDEAVGVTGVA